MQQKLRYPVFYTLGKLLTVLFSQCNNYSSDAT